VVASAQVVQMRNSGGGDSLLTLNALGQKLGQPRSCRHMKAVGQVLPVAPRLHKQHPMTGAGRRYLLRQPQSDGGDAFRGRAERSITDFRSVLPAARPSMIFKRGARVVAWADLVRDAGRETPSAGVANSPENVAQAPPSRCREQRPAGAPAEAAARLRAFEGLEDPAHGCSTPRESRKVGLAVGTTERIPRP
jgi:hypothetical protein